MPFDPGSEPDPADQRDTQGEAPGDSHDHAWEDALEPRHLINRCNAVLRVGAAMLAAGTGGRRVVETMRAVARALDLDDIQTRVSLTEIVLTVHRRGIIRTQTAQIPSPGVNADQIAALQRFARSLPEHATVAQVHEGLQAILHRRKQWPAWAGPAGAGVACGAFAYLNHGSATEIAAVLVAATAGQVVRRALHRRQLNQLAMAFVAALVAGGVFLGLTELVQLWQPQLLPSREVGFFSSILFLVPGFPLMTAALDLARLDLAAGITRLTYAALLTFAAGCGIWMIALLAGVQPATPAAAGGPTVGLVLAQMLASFLGVFGFAVIFNSPPRCAFVAGLIALVANPARLLLTDAGWPMQNAAATGTLLVGLLAWVFGRYTRLPRIILSVPSVVIMIPGVPTFRCLVYFNDGDLLQALQVGLTAAITVLGMAMGLVAARMLTDQQWAYSTPNPPHYATLLRRLNGPRPPRSRPGRPRRQAREPSQVQKEAPRSTP